MEWNEARLMRMGQWGIGRGGRVLAHPEVGLGVGLGVPDPRRVWRACRPGVATAVRRAVVAVMEAKVTVGELLQHLFSIHSSRSWSGVQRGRGGP